jgi:4-hydroxy-tetrahydrodipicolinate reductase
MGQAIAVSVRQRSDLELLGLWQRGQDLDGMVAAADVVIDFSLPEGTELVLQAVVRHGTPLVCGVTGLNESQHVLLAGASEQLPLVFDRNMSLGIAILGRAVREAAAALGTDFAVQVSEVHHVHKKDAPSGTALKLGEAIAASRGETGTGAVQFKVERRGETPGDHEVTMASTTEKLTFAHSVMTRQVFVDGALAAAAWVIGKPAGRYSMQDVLFSHPNS